MDLAPDVKEFLRQAKVARLATADRNSIPHLVPVVFVPDKNDFLIPIDGKNKTVPLEQLKRIKNIKSNPQICLLVDTYDDDWAKLRYVMITGTARLTSIETQSAFHAVRQMFVKKYPQYASVELYNLFITITPRKVISWTNSSSGKLG